MTRTCIDCAAPIGRKSKGRCRPCACRRLSSDPAILARREATNARLRLDPDHCARHSEACRQAKLRLMENPAALERLREAGRRVGRLNFWHANTPAAREAARLAIRRRHLAWCPEEHWPLNSQLKRKGLRLAERKAAILELVPGTIEHARRTIANRQTAQRIRAERDRQQSY